MRELEVVSPHARLVRGLLGGWAVLVYIFLFAPIVLLVLFSFNANKYGTFPFTGWTTSWYADVFHNYQIKDALYTTLKVAAQVTLVRSTSRLTPIRSPGIMIGSVIPIRTPLRKGSRDRTSGKAAAVPTIVAITVTSAEMRSVVYSASLIW